MEQTIEFLKEVSANTINVLSRFKETGRKGDFSFEFDCATSADYLHINILETGEFVEMFNRLKNIVGPVIYWIDIVSDTSTQEIIKAANSYKEKKLRHVPAMKKRIDYESRVLYVGKVEKDIFVRVLTHMGFHKSAKTQGLQMFHWGKDIALKVKFNLIHLDFGCEPVLAVWEKSLAGRVKPVIGKHK